MFKFLTRAFNKEQPETYTEEGIKEKRELLELSIEDDELMKRINEDIKDAMPLYEKMKAIQDENELYYLGSQLDENVFNYQLPSDQNILYRNLETTISIMTSQRKEPIVLPTQDNDESKTLARTSQQFLTWKWGDEEMSIKFEDWVRNASIYRIGVFKIRWNLEKDDFEILNKRPQTIMIDKDATNEYDAKFIVEYEKDTLGDLMEMFPKKKEELKKSYGNALGTPITYVGYWTNEFVVWKVENIILDKKKNPNWNWDEDEKDRKENLKKLKEKWIKKTKDEKLENILLNYFNEPRKPFVILSLKNLGKTIYADTSDFDQGKKGQDIVNRRKRQLDKAAIHALGREVYSGSFISKEEAKKSVANPNSPVWLKSGRAQDAITHIGPQPMSPVLLEDLRDSKAELDNIMAAHGTTRGERGAQETAAGRTILREGDFGRADLAVRRIDKKLELLYSWMLQMAKVYYTEIHYKKIMGEEGAVTYLNFSQDDIEDGQEIIVKSELTADKATKREEVIGRMKAGLLDPLTYFEKFDEPNPKELARRLVFYNIEPKLYIQQFCIDENTEGVENDPVMKARQENKKIMNKEEVPPFQGATKEHILEHNKFAESDEFKNLEDVGIKNNFLTHLQGEIEILRKTKV